jgi:lysophospholipase L1-like esterase
VDVLARALNLFNKKLLQVCRATDSECVDLAAAMNGDERYFYDDVHFNEPGARVVAALLADYLKPTR